MEPHRTTPHPLCRGLAIIFAAVGLCGFMGYGDELVTLRHEVECILSAVAQHMGIALRSDIPPPEVRYSSTTPLAEFQRAAESVSNLRPPAVSNAYFASLNVIFLTDNPAYYRQGRTLDDALAHEYTHFLQDRYGAGAAREDDDCKEREAARVQLWFRATFMSDPALARPPCLIGPP